MANRAAGLVFLILIWGCGSTEETEAVCDLCAQCPQTDAEAAGCDATPCIEPDSVTCPELIGQDTQAADVSCPDQECPAADCTQQCEPVTPEAFCAALQADVAEENLRSVWRFAYGHAQALVHGTFEETKEVQGGTLYGRLVVDAIPFGWSFLVGQQVWVPIPEDYPEPLVSTTWTVALSNSRPTLWEAEGILEWGNLLALIPDDEMETIPMSVQAARCVGLMAAEVRIVQQDEYRTTFEVVDALKGSFPATFADNWYAQWNLPYPAPSDQKWLVTLSPLTPYEESGGTLYIGTIYDAQPSTPQAKEQLLQLLALSPPQEEVVAWQAERQRYQESFQYHSAPWVVSSVVTGRADECCTGAGGTYFAHEVLQYLKGQLSSDLFVTGGHAYYGEEQCGDGFLVALGGYLDPTALMVPPFDCKEYPDSSVWEAWEPIESQVALQKPVSQQLLADVASWVAASPPVYQLLPASQSAAPEVAAQDPNNAPWSMPMDAIQALRFGSEVAIVTIKEVVSDEAAGTHVVTIETTFSLYEYDHIPRYQLKMAFSCGDPRLLEVGARWVAGLYRPNRSAPPDDPSNSSSLFMIPGSLLPTWAVTMQLEAVLAYAW